MKDNSSNFLQAIFRSALLAYAVLFFLSVGSDFPGHYQLRIAVGVLLVVLSLVAVDFRRAWISPGKFTVLAFLVFLIFEWLRYGWAAYAFYRLDQAAYGPLAVLPLRWSFCFWMFAVAWASFGQRKAAERLEQVTMWTLLFLALNVVPTLLLSGRPGEGVAQSDFFFSFFYFHPFIGKYVLAPFTHPNYAGDVMAFGFFPCLALFFYSLQQLQDKSARGTRSAATALLGLRLTCALLAAATILLFFSRGTIVAFSLMFLFFFSAMLIKYWSVRNAVISGAIFVVAIGFVAWAGNLNRAWKEVRTLEQELDAEKHTSYSVNREGFKRGMAIYRDHRLWGAGPGGYARLSPKYLQEDVYLADLTAMCHYVHMLTDEGSGAFLYFLFLAVYILEMLRGLLTTKSRFAFFMGLALFSACLMVLVHAAINFLLQRFDMSMLLYFFMGASLAVLKIPRPAQIPAK